MAKLIPSVSTNEERCTLAFHAALVFILKGHNLDSGMLLDVKRPEMSLLNYFVFLMSSNTLRLTEQGRLRKYTFGLHLECRSSKTCSDKSCGPQPTQLTGVSGDQQSDWCCVSRGHLQLWPPVLVNVTVSSYRRMLSQT